MRYSRLALAVVAGLAVISVAGCNTVGGLFGYSPPSYKLTDAAKMVRSAHPSPADLPKETRKALHPAYVVEPGDTLLVQPADLDSPIRLPGDQPVLADGTIDLGRFGRPVVAGKTLPAIEAELNDIVRRAVAAEARPDAPNRRDDERPETIHVRLVGRASKVYYVIGEVNAPGVYPITGRETVLDGIFAAGNLTRQASKRDIILARPTSPEGCRIVLPICWNDIVQLADPRTNYQLMPGDRIYVPSKGTFEDFHARKSGECPPCGGWQEPCGLPGGGCPTPAGASPAAD